MFSSADKADNELMHSEFKASLEDETSSFDLLDEPKSMQCLIKFQALVRTF